MVGQQLPCALRRAMCPASGDDAVRRHFLAPCPFLPGQLSFSDPPLPCASCAFPLPRACGCPAPGTYGVASGSGLYGYSGPWPVFAAFPPLAKSEYTNVEYESIKIYKSINMSYKKSRREFQRDGGPVIRRPGLGATWGRAQKAPEGGGKKKPAERVEELTKCFL